IIVPPLLPLPPVPAGREGREPATVCLIQTFYLRDEGKLQLPVSGPAGTKAAIVELHAPVGMKFVYWVAARNALLPALPDFRAMAKLGETLAGWMISPIAPGVMIDGVTYEFSCSGTYAYYLDLPPDPKTGLPMGRRSFDSAPGQVLTAANLSQNWRGL